MPHVRRPPRGDHIFYRKTGVVIGLFRVDRKRIQRTLCRLEEIERAPSGRLRTDGQITSAAQTLWERKAAELEQERERAVREETHGRPIQEAMKEWKAAAEKLGKAPSPFQS